MKTKRTKVLSVVLILVLLMGTFLTACGSDSNNASNKPPAKQYELILAHALSATSTQNEGAMYFAKLVKERTNGEVTIKVYSDGQLGGEREIFEGQSLGSIDIGIGGGSAIGSVNTIMNSMLSGPFFGISGWESADTVYYGAKGDAITTASGGFWGKVVSDCFAENDMTYLGVYDNGFRGISNNVRPITVASDMQGLKIRVPESDAYLKFFGALNAITTPMAFTELYTALQQGTVDGQDNGVGLTFSSGFGEVQAYYTELNYMYGALYMSISNSSLESLPTEYQDIVVQAALESCVYHNTLQREQYAADKQGLIEQGVEFYPLSKAERQTFIDATVSVREWQTSKVGQEYKDMWDKYMME